MFDGGSFDKLLVKFYPSHFSIYIKSIHQNFSDPKLKFTNSSKFPPIKYLHSTVYCKAHNTIIMTYRYPVMWQGHFTLKNDMAAVQLHFLSGNMELAKKSLPFPTPEKPTPSLRIAQRMRLEATQIEGVEKRIQVEIISIM